MSDIELKQAVNLLTDGHTLRETAHIVNVSVEELQSALAGNNEN